MKLPNFHLIQIRNLSGEIHNNIVDVIMGFKSRVLRVPILTKTKTSNKICPVLCGYFDLLNNLGGSDIPNPCAKSLIFLQYRFQFEKIACPLPKLMQILCGGSGALHG